MRLHPSLNPWTHRVLAMISMATCLHGFSGAAEIMHLNLRQKSPDMRPEHGLTIRSMGPDSNPAGHRIGYTSKYLTFDEAPWMPVMGEFHFSRFDPTSWEFELQKMKAGGIDLVATYVFWIHHEEKEGEWNWSGQRNVRAFVEAADRAGLQVFLRIGPWCHGEVRNGGLPDWVVSGDWKVRTNDPAYLEKVEALYDQIARQVEGLLWKDGGPVIGVQLENEYGGKAAHLMELKRLAVEAGLETPLYTKTGWPKLKDSMPYDEMLPLFGVYAEGFWNASLDPMPGNYREGFHFSKTRTSSDIGSDQLVASVSKDEVDAQRYPYLTCEVGGGMMNSYHRRVLIEPIDVVSTALVKFGSGGNLLGYYMYHGGWNPEGRYSTLHESLETRYPNDMPVKNYDFQAPVGAAGTLREHYHELKQIHFFMRDYERWIAHLDTYLPEDRPQSLEDTKTLRWSVRSDGESGLLFFNNYERLQSLARHEVQFKIEGLKSGALIIPSNPVTIEPGDLAYWPFRWHALLGLTLEWITAQPICQIQDASGNWVLFMKQTGEIPVEMAMKQSVASNFEVLKSDELISNSDAENELERFKDLSVDRVPAIELRHKHTGVTYRIIVLSETTARHLWKGSVAGQSMVLLSEHEVIFEEDGLQLRYSDQDSRELRAIFSSFPEIVWAGEQQRVPCKSGIWTTYELPEASSFRRELSATFRKTKEAGVPRDIPFGPYRSKAAMAPVDSDFDSAAVWNLVPLNSDQKKGWQEILLRIDYRADVLRWYAGDTLLFDDFYNGRDVELALYPMTSQLDLELEDIGLNLKLLPLKPDSAPIYLHPRIRELLLLEGPREICLIDNGLWVLRNPLSIRFEW